jgi:hypothetical protein
MSILQAYCFDNLRTIGGIYLQNLGMQRVQSIYNTSSSWGNPPMIDAQGWMCAYDGNGVGEYRGQLFERFVPDKTKAYWFAARFRNVSNAGYGLFRFQNDAGTAYEPILSNHASLGFLSGTGTPEAFIELELNYPLNLIRFYKDGAQVFEGSFSGLQAALYAFFTSATPITFGVLYKTATPWTAATPTDQFKFRDASVVIDDGVGITKRMGVVNIKRAPIVVDSVVGGDKDAAGTQTVLNQAITNTVSGGQFAKPSGSTKLTAANSAVNFHLDLSGVPGKRLAVGVIVGARRTAVVQPVVELSQVVNGTTYKETVPLATPNTNQDYESWTNPRNEFAAANVDLATVNFSLTLKDPA